ncbi:radical SAM protein [candidate division WOR-3 bacterium]|nr:radical SAM protein [candidate division WOR-3 bacterium]
MKVEFKELKGNVIHDFPYPKEKRKCPHTVLISITHSGCCIHKCPMCYARAYPWSIEDRIVIYKNVPEKLETEIKKTKILPPFYLSQVSDALQPVSEVREITFKVVRILIKYKLSFHILTKSAEGAINLIETIPELIKYPYWYLGMTVESPPEKQAITSPYASEIEARFRALKKLNSYGIPLVGRTDPTILGFVEIPEVCYLIKRLADAGVQHIIGSLGYYNPLSMGRLLKKIELSKWKECIPDVEKIYGYHLDSIDNHPKRKRFIASVSRRIKFHSILRKEAEKYKLTYSVCLELSREYDSKGLLSCEGIYRNFVHIKKVNGKFYPINCCADCLSSCPDKINPPCGEKKLQSEYPYRLKTLN